jgi:mRNA interferase RelE/StbE
VTYRIEIKESARKALRGLPSGDQRRIVAKIDALATEPRPHGSTRLKGPEDFLRIRAGDYRVIYQIEDDILIVLVVRIAHRREAYR